MDEKNLLEPKPYREGGGKVSPKARRCPHCGHFIKRGSGVMNILRRAYSKASRCPRCGRQTRRHPVVVDVILAVFLALMILAGLYVYLMYVSLYPS
jgi:ribosomal protein S27AE